MPLNAPSIVLLSAFALHAAVFWDAPRQWLRAKREGVVTRSRTYHVANIGILGLLLAAVVGEVFWPARPGFHPTAGIWRATSWAAAAAGIAGLSLAAWAKVTLGAWFAPTAARFHGQFVLRQGPYRWLRNPMYVGWWLFLVSLAWTANSVPLVAAATLVAPLLWMLGRHERAFLSAGE